MKKVISILLSVLIVLSGLSFSAFAEESELISSSDALKQYEEQTGEKVDTYRYYFLMPDGTNGERYFEHEYNLDGEIVATHEYYEESWYNEHTDTAGIYWWDSGVADPEDWPGYTMEKGDSDSVFYADVPQRATTIIFNNSINGGMDNEDPLYYLAHQTINVPCEYYDPGENDNYPNGTDSFDDMIFVVEPGLSPCCEITEKHTAYGEWYYYYGDGCYGFVKDGDSTNCLRDDHNHNHDYSEGSVKDAIAEYEKQTGEKVDTYRYYFLMPDGTNGEKGDNEYSQYYDEYAQSWYNDHTDTAGIYWWGSGVADPAGWPGYTMEKSDSDSVFYADVPQEVTTIIFNNSINGGTDPEDPIYRLSSQTTNIPCEYYVPGESDNYPQGTESFDNMIFVVDPQLIPVSDYNQKSTYGGEWYYYYGDGCYGFVKDGDSTNCLRDDHNHDHNYSEGSVKDAIAEYEKQTGEKVETNRYYFLMPDGTNGEKGDDNSVDENGNPLSPYGEYEKSWYNEYTDTAGVYWWDAGIADPVGWPGYTMEKGDSESVYYADIPTAVTVLIFNNYIDGGMDPSEPIYSKAKQTFNIGCEYYDVGENDNYPNGTESFDNMIFVGDPDMCSHSDLSYANKVLEGEWYYYYGDGCYGFVKDGDSTNCLRDDHNHDADKILGDVDGDGVVSVIDATAIQRDSAKLEMLTDEQKLRADVDGDTKVTVLDATAIQMIIAKLD